MLPVTRVLLVIVITLASISPFTDSVSHQSTKSKSQRSRFLQSFVYRSDRNTQSTTTAATSNKNYILAPPKYRPIDLKGKYLMPLFSTGSALTQQLRFKPLNLNSKKYAKKILSGTYQPIIPLRFDFSNHRPKDTNLIEKIYSLSSNLPSRIFFNEDDATHRIEEKSNVPKIVSRLSEVTNEKKLHKKNKPDAGEEKRQIRTSINEAGTEAPAKKKKKSDDNDNDNDDDDGNTVKQTIASQRTNRVSRLEVNKNGDKQNSSYDLTQANQRSLVRGNPYKKLRGDSLSLFEPSLESIALRIVSAAASKTMGRSNYPAQSSSSSSGTSSSLASQSESAQGSFLSSLSSTLLSTAISHIINMTSLNSTISESPNSWPAKLYPLLQSLSTLSGDFPNQPSSFLPADLFPASSVSTPVVLSSNSSRPHTAKQNSPTVAGLVNLMRYVLCKYSKG